VSTRGNDSDEVVVRTLVGEYTESSSNHGRKVYKKVADKAGELVDVYLYYWDNRDGPAFEGWWFGNKLGGTQVWSHNASAAMTPPPSGWKIPWDGAIRSTLSVASKATQMKNEAESKLKSVHGEIATVSGAAKAALEKAKAAAGTYTSGEGLRNAEQLLQPQLTALAEAMKSLTDAQRSTTPDAIRQVQGYRTQLQALMSSINVELGKVRSSKTKAEQSEKQQAVRDRDMALLQEVMPEATAKANAAEDAVEKAVITAEMITAAGDELSEVQEAVGETEKAVQEAQKAMGEARIFLNAKQASARRFESDEVKAKAAQELGQLQTQLQEAQQKLNPLKTVRQDFVQRTAAQKAVQEILEKLSPAEVDVDRAQEATEMLKGEGFSKELIQQANQAVAKAGDHIANVIRFIEQKKKTAVGKAKEELAKMEDRARASQTKLTNLKNENKEATERINLEVLLKEASDKLQTVADAVSKASDAEGPFLMGVEELPIEENMAAIKACETAATSANTSASIARMYFATKLVEAKRFTPEMSKQAQAKLKELQTELETHTKRLNELKKATADRKKASVMKEAEHEVKKAEELVEKVAEAAAPLQEDDKLLTLSSQEIQTASEAAIKAEQACSLQLSEARKFITAKQIEAKGRDASAETSAELIKFETRLRNAQTEAAKYKKVSQSVDSRLAAKKVIEDATSKVKAVEEKLEKLKNLAEAISSPAEGADGKEATTTAEKAAADAQGTLKAAGRFIDMQVKMQTAAAKEVEKLQPRLTELQEQLDSTIASMKEASEKATLDAIAKESEERVKAAEESVKKLQEAEKQLESAGELAAEKVSDVLKDLDEAVQAANSAVSGAKTFIGMKKLAARRLTEAMKKSAEEQLQGVQTRIEELAKTLQETKKNISERKLAAVQREVVAKVEESEKKVQEAEEATEALKSVGKEAKEGEDVADGSKGAAAPADQMKAACEKAGASQQDARSFLTAAQKLLLGRQKDAKIAASSEITTEITKNLEKLSKFMGRLDKLKTLLRDQEHRFVAQRLLKDATEQMERLEKKLEETAAKASPLTQGEGMTAVVYLTHTVDRLKQELKKTSKTPKDLFKDLCGDKAVLAESAFVSHVRSLEQADSEDILPSEEQLKAAFKRMTDGADGAEVTEERFLEEFRSRFLCTGAVTMTDGLVIKGGKTVRKVDPNEVLEALGEPTKEEALGLMRVNVKAEKDGKEGFVTVAGNQGTVYLEAYTQHNALQKTMEAELKTLFEAGKDTAKYLETKVEELKAVRSGPLADTKAELLKLKPRVAKVQAGHNDMKKKVAQADKTLSSVIEEEKKKRAEAASKKAADAVVEEVTKLVTAAEEIVGKAAPAAEGLIASLGGDQDNPLAAMDAAEKSLVDAEETLKSTLEKIKGQMEGLKGQPAKGPYAEARNSLVKMKVKTGAMESKCKKLIAGLKSARKDLAGEAEEAIRAALGRHVREKGLKSEELVTKLSDGQQDVSAAALRKFLESIDSGLKAAQLDLGLAGFSGGLTKMTMLDMLQEFQKCVKEISLTTHLEMKEGKSVRKLAVGELLEVLEFGTAETLTRIRCRALVDLKEGWVTPTGSAGTNFLERCSKPYYCCEQENTLSAAFESSSSEVRKVQPGEVLEFLEGPRKEEPPEVLRLRGKAIKDGKIGWVTLKSMTGNELFKLAKLLVCKQSIAITTTFDIAAGKAIRKLEVGETLEILEGPQEDSVRSLSRVRVTAKKDGKEGWVTVKGNQGTSYAEESDKHYVCSQATTLEKSLATGSAEIRAVEEGEAFEALEKPKTEKKSGIERVRCRSLADGKEGWFTLNAKAFTAWAPLYTCAQSTVLNDGVEIKEAKTLRKLEPGEMLEVLQPPVKEETAGLLRIKVRAKKDQLVGFATVRGNQGTVLLKPVLNPEKPPASAK